jgi:hypothetical protein
MQQSPRSHFHFHALDSLPQSTRSLGILLAKQPPRGLVRVNFPRERLMAPVLEMLMLSLQQEFTASCRWLLGSVSA